jgi:cathepsin L
MTSCVNNSKKCGGTGGCFGATSQIGWDYLVQAGGQVQEWTYGYTSYWGTSGVCDLNVNMTQEVQLTGYTQVASNDPNAVVEALNAFGPLAVSVDASNWFEYESGIYSGCDYSKNISMDHAVQLIGYGVDNGTAYWLVRNSWSASWGENGYIRLIRNLTQEQCGWNVDWISNGGGCPGGANTVWACGQCGILYDTAFPNVKTSQSSSSASKAWIAGAVIGGVVVIAIVVAIFFKVSAGAAHPESDQLLDRQ